MFKKTIRNRIMSNSVRFNITEKSKPIIMFNIGALFDIPTANFIKGSKGETIINGGLGPITGIVGHGNNFKSTIMHYMALSALNRIYSVIYSSMLTYDTEINISLDRLNHLGYRMEYLPEDLIKSENPLWEITDKSKMSANEWYKKIVEYTKEKTKSKDGKVKLNAFLDPYTRKELEITIPSLAQIDSMSEFEPESTVDVLSGDLDDSSTNTYAMKQGGYKSKLMSQLPRIANSSNTYIMMTAHIGAKINMETGPMAKYNQPTKKLQHIKKDDAVKGVSDKFYFLLNQAYYAHTATVLKNKTTKQAEYPIKDEESFDTDLNLVKLTFMRNKNGGSGNTIELVVSQIDGVLPTLTEFHHIKTNDRYGLDGSNINYHLSLYPDVNLTRTNVRSKIDLDEKLRRAINITSELLQLKKHHPTLVRSGVYCTPSELYNDIKELGYDWDILLSTRGWWAIDNYSEDLDPYLSTLDLLYMRKGTYIPYWYPDKDKIKKVDNEKK